MFTVALFLIAQKWQQPKRLLGEWVNQLWYIYNVCVCVCVCIMYKYIIYKFINTLYINIYVYKYIIYTHICIYIHIHNEKPLSDKKKQTTDKENKIDEA